MHSKYLTAYLQRWEFPDILQELKKLFSPVGTWNTTRINDHSVEGELMLTKLTLPIFIDVHAIANQDILGVVVNPVNRLVFDPTGPQVEFLELPSQTLLAASNQILKLRIWTIMDIDFGNQHCPTFELIRIRLAEFAKRLTRGIYFFHTEY